MRTQRQLLFGYMTLTDRYNHEISSMAMSLLSRNEAEQLEDVHRAQQMAGWLLTFMG